MFILQELRNSGTQKQEIREDKKQRTSKRLIVFPFSFCECFFSRNCFETSPVDCRLDCLQSRPISLKHFRTTATTPRTSCFQNIKSDTNTNTCAIYTNANCVVSSDEPFHSSTSGPPNIKWCTFLLFQSSNIFKSKFHSEDFCYFKSYSASRSDCKLYSLILFIGDSDPVSEKAKPP